MRRSWPLILLTVLTLLTHFVFFGHPDQTVFDEVHFGKFISGYFTHEYFFDIHPPLGKLLMSGVGYLAGFEPGFSFSDIGQEFNDRSYLWLRLLPMLAGALLPIIIYFLMLQLGLSRRAAFAAGAFLAIENSLLVQSRFILLDSFLLLFGFSALLSYFKYRKSKSLGYLAASGILAALAVSVKWTGATFLGLIVLMEAWDILKTMRSDSMPNHSLMHLRSYLIARLSPYLLKRLVILLILPAAIYFSFFAIHIELLRNSGSGDAFMSREFQKTLSGSVHEFDENVEPLNIFEKFKELNVEMYQSNARLSAGHPYSSAWYTWPFMTRPIYYWNGHQERNEGGQILEQSRIYLIGNPIIWWASTIAMLFMLLELSRSVFNYIRKRFFEYPKVFLLLSAGFIFNLLPFVGIDRVMFLYHYMTAMVFAIMALAYLVDTSGNRKRIFLFIFIAGLAAFLFFSPLTYGLPLSEKGYDARVWFATWR
ncbi:MAG: phospholipid carrier-dependent glycosyltransferase [Candidatus Paceibacterota bacterium]